LTSPSSSVCQTASPSVITSVVTQVSTKTVDHFITVTVGENGRPPSPSTGNASGSKGQAGNLGQPSQHTPKVPAITTKTVSTYVLLDQDTYTEYI
jgi:hypothetical protein